MIAYVSLGVFAFLAGFLLCVVVPALLPLVCAALAYIVDAPAVLFRRLFFDRARRIYPKAHKGALYLRRLYLSPVKWPIRIFLHKICLSDLDKDLHDHPWDFVSIVLKGAYTEEIRDRPGAATRLVRRERFSVAYRPAETQHRVTLDLDPSAPARVTFDPVDVKVEGPNARIAVPMSFHEQPQPCWTLVFAFRARRQWGFGAAEGHVHVPWRLYLGLSPDIPDSAEDVS